MKKYVWISLMAGLYAAAFAEKPVIFWASDPVKPNETLMVQGDLLDGSTQVQIARLKNTRPGKPELNTVDFSKINYESLPSLQPSVQTGKYVVPADWELAIYAIRPVRGQETGELTRVNAPDVWWIQGSQVTWSTPDSEFSVYGKCLSYGTAKVYLQDEAGKFLEMKLLEQDLWHIKAALGNVGTGDYQVFVHNGLGGRFGWVKAGSLTIKEKKAWPQTVFNVVDYGAKPNFDPNRSRLDKTNDSPAFQRALDAAGENGGGVVYIPKGCYQLVEALNVPRFVTIRGESMLSTNLGWDDNEEPPLGLINGTSQFAVEDLTIFVQNYWSVIRGDHGHLKDSGNIAVRRVTIRANRYVGIMGREYENWKEMQIERRWNTKLREAALNFGGENIVITDCDVLASNNSLILDNASGVVANNRLYCPYTFQADQYWIRGCHDLIVKNNDIYGGGCMGTHTTTRGIHNQKGREVYLNTVSRNIYFAGNKQFDNWKWDREMMTLDSHGYGGPYLGPVAAAEGNTVTFPDPFPVLSAGGEIFSKSGSVQSQKKLVNGRYYKMIARLESKKEALDWDRSFVNFYDMDQAVEANEPEQFDRNGDSRHYAHGKVNVVRIRGAKDFEVKEVRIAQSWQGLQDAAAGEPVFANVRLNGKDSPQKDTGVLFDFDADGVLYVSVIVKANGPMCTGQVELLMENGKRALDLGISRLGGIKVDFNRIPPSPNQSANNINLFKGAYVYVLEGKGCGQYRKIVDGSGATLVVDRPWDVALDDTSVISVHRTHDHQIFVHNDYTDGGMALQMYGGAVETIIADNTATRAGGFLVTGLHACIPMYCQFLNNTVVSGAGLGGPPFNLRGGRISVEPYRPVGYHNGFQSIGIVMRNNRFENMASANVAGPVQNVLIEDNYFANTETAIMVHSEGMGSFLKSWYWPQDVLIRNNQTENVESLLKAEKEATVKVCN